MIRKSIPIMNTKSYYTFISYTGVEVAFSWCSAWVRSVGPIELLVQFPLDWSGPYATEKEHEKWKTHINKLGGSVEFMEIGQYFGSKVKDMRTQLLYRYKTVVNMDLNEFVTTNEWSKWKIPNGITSRRRYYTLCLLRYMYCSHLSPIVDRYYDIVEKLPDIEPVKALQLAHLAYESTTDKIQRYCDSYTCFDNTTCKLIDFDQVDTILSTHPTYLQKGWNREEYRGKKQIRELLLNGEYKTAYNELNG